MKNFNNKQKSSVLKIYKLTFGSDLIQSIFDFGLEGGIVDPDKMAASLLTIILSLFPSLFGFLNAQVNLGRSFVSCWLDAGFILGDCQKEKKHGIKGRVWLLVVTQNKIGS